MTDIVKRLRLVQGDNEDAREAAAELERLQQECARMASEKACLGIDMERLRAEHESYVEWTQANLEPSAYCERLRALLHEAVLYDSQIIHMESWWRKVRALEQKP